jgi:hypothetical protein
MSDTHLVRTSCRLFLPDERWQLKTTEREASALPY